jgi:hypothetical protein
VSNLTESELKHFEKIKEIKSWIQQSPWSTNLSVNQIIESAILIYKTIKDEIEIPEEHTTVYGKIRKILEEHTTVYGKIRKILGGKTLSVDGAQHIIREVLMHTTINDACQIICSLFSNSQTLYDSIRRKNVEN